MPQFKGHKLCVEWGQQADKTFDVSIKQIQPDRRNSAKAQLRALIEQLANSGRLKSPEQFRNEGDGFYAIRTKIGLRAYGWFANKKNGVSVKGLFAISHFIKKKKDKLDPRDKALMIRSRQRYEQQGID
ncbi:MAG: hypothetical protein HC808_19680 [Candidatus Competibacteraceae bacterium]|nr:hypothetical protein [Candidatus Competibacteraceae bacterium]